MYRQYFKRLLDVFWAIVLFPFVGSVIALAGLSVWLEDRGPVFYVSRRLGKDGRLFWMYKLRSMKVNSPDIRNDDGSTFNSASDPRLTRVGSLLRRTSIDELPQIINVIKGDMSFVGPRPDLPEHANYYDPNEQRKLDVLPGITGYNQAYFRNSVEWKHRLQNDVHYADNLSFLFDARIVLQTLVGIVAQRDVFAASRPGWTSHDK